MIVAEEISEKVRRLPMHSQAKVLDFVEGLLSKNGGGNEVAEWGDFSLTQAMRGLEDDGMPEYTNADLKEKWLG